MIDLDSIMGFMSRVARRTIQYVSFVFLMCVLAVLLAHFAYDVPIENTPEFWILIKGTVAFVMIITPFLAAFYLSNETITFDFDSIMGFMSRMVRRIIRYVSFVLLMCVLTVLLAHFVYDVPIENTPEFWILIKGTVAFAIGIPFILLMLVAGMFIGGGARKGSSSAQDDYWMYIGRFKGGSIDVK